MGVTDCVLALWQKPNKTKPDPSAAHHLPSPVWMTDSHSRVTLTTTGELSLLTWSILIQRLG